MSILKQNKVSESTIAQIVLPSADLKQQFLLAEQQWKEQWATRPKMRGWLHAVAAPVAIVATTLIATKRKQQKGAMVAYAAGISSMFTTSAIYHRLTRNKKQFHITQAADHAMIFAAIAGTATPVVVAVVPPQHLKKIVTGIWGAAALGAAGKIVDLNKQTSFTNIFYVVCGWSALSLLPNIIKTKGIKNAGLLLAGGTMYTAGAIAFSGRKLDINPKVFGYHEVWHVATITGAALHMVAIADITKEKLSA